MIVLDDTDRSLIVKLGGAVAADQPEFVASYADQSATAFTPGANIGETNDTNEVTLISAPAAATKRQVKTIMVHNLDSAAVTVILQYADDAVRRTIFSEEIPSGGTIILDGARLINGLQGAVLSDDDPEDTGVADPGVSGEVSRVDHVHAVTVDDSTIEDDSGTIQVKDAGITAAKMEHAPTLMTRVESAVSVTTTAPLDSTAFGKLHTVAGTTAQYNITLPNPSGNAGKRIAFQGGSTTALTYVVFVVPYGSEKIAGLYRAMIVPDRYFVLECDGTNWSIVAQNEYKLTGNMTIYMPAPSGGDDTNILNWYYIEPAPRDLGTYTLTFAFDDGSHSRTYLINTGSLVFTGFHNGNVTISGDTSISGASMSQGIVLDGSSYTDGSVIWVSNSANVFFTQFKIIWNGSGSGIRFVSSVWAYATSCYTVGSTTGGSGAGYSFYGCIGYVRNCYVEKGNRGIYANGSRVWSRDNNDNPGGTMPAYGIMSTENASVGKHSSTQPDGSTSDESASSGGVIR